MGWMIYIVAVLVVSGVIGMHLRCFAEAYTEMTGMMAGMTMGMLNGFVLGYAAAGAVGASATGAMFWGNLFGILMGLTLGVYFGRPGGLMGIMDGAMGGVMGGSMGAMLSVMVRFPEWAIFWTGVLLTVVYVAGMVGLVVLIERSAPGHEALHRLAPFFTRAISIEAAETEDRAEEAYAAGYAASSNGRSNGNGASQRQEKQRRIVNYYALLGVGQNASEDDIIEAYLEKLDGADQPNAERLERAVAVLTSAHKRETYDLRLAESQAPISTPLASNGKGSGGRADCCPPPKQKKTEAAALAAAVPASATQNQATMNVASQTEQQGAITGRPAGSGKAYQGPGNGPTGKYDGNSQNGNARNASRGSEQGSSSHRSKHGKGGGQRQTGNQATRKQQVKYAQTQQRSASPISWVGGLAIIVILCALGWWMLSASSGVGARGAAAGIQTGASGQSLSQLDSQAVVAPVGADGKQTLDVVLDSATFQYKPSVIKVKQGVPVHFNLSVENGDPG